MEGGQGRASVAAHEPGCCCARTALGQGLRGAGGHRSLCHLLGALPLARLLPGQRSAARLLAWVNVFYLGNLAGVCLPGAFIFIAVASCRSCVPSPLPHGRALREVFPSLLLEALGAASLLPSMLVAVSPGRLPQAGAAGPGSWLWPRRGRGPGLGVLCPLPRCIWGWASTMR